MQDHPVGERREPVDLAGHPSPYISTMPVEVGDVLAVLALETVGVGLRAEHHDVGLQLLDLGDRPVLEGLAQHGRAGAVVEPRRDVGPGQPSRTR